MTVEIAPLAPRRRAVFVSDVHLGSKHCHAAEFADFLEVLRCDRLYLIGDWLYYRILTGNRWLKIVRQRFGLRYWSLSEFFKRRSGAAERYIARFMQAGFDDARRRGLDGIVCGHIHRAALFEHDGCVYANDGDWVESLTAVAEDPDGSLRLLAHTGETLALLPPAVSTTTSPALFKAA